jgi:small subunit ribosomal protein S18
MIIEKDKKASDKKRKRTFLRRKVCVFCMEKGLTMDYKNPFLLKKFVTERGRIVPRRISGICGKHQKDLAKTIKRARHCALMPYTTSSLL